MRRVTNKFLNRRYEEQHEIYPQPASISSDGANRSRRVSEEHPARHGMTAPAAQLESERFEAVVSKSGPPQQKSTNVKSATRLDSESPMLGKILKDAGYVTAHFGKWHLGRESGEHIEDRMAKKAVAWLKNRDRSKPSPCNL